MQLELTCFCCGEDFVHEPAAYARDELDRVRKEVMWEVLGDGGTLEDSLHAAFSAGGAISCPTCESVVPVNEDALGRLAMTMLGSW